MKKRLIVMFTSVLMYSCTLKEAHVKEDRVTGLYKRSCFKEEEFLCLKDDHTYRYFLNSNGSEEKLNSGKWIYNNSSGRSYITLTSFNYSIILKKYFKDTSGIAVPIKYSYNRDAVLLRMNPDAFSEDFVRIDSTSCEVKSPE